MKQKKISINNITHRFRYHIPAPHQIVTVYTWENNDENQLFLQLNEQLRSLWPFQADAEVKGHYVDTTFAWLYYCWRFRLPNRERERVKVTGHDHEIV